jgi:PP-loop superfamily ATP-utilizing enzyme
MSYNLHNIDGVILPFDKTWVNLAIGLSGGADSALLTYLLCDLINKTKS